VGNTSFFKHSFLVAFDMLRSPVETLEQVRSEKTHNALVFLLTIGAVTALLTQFQVLLGFEDVNGLHAGGQAEYLARDVSAMYQLGWNVALCWLRVSTFSFLRFQLRTFTSF